MEELALCTGGTVLQNPDVLIENLMTDSRTALASALFFARRGERHDSGEYIEDAVKNGAIAVCTQKDRCYIPPRNIGHIVADDIEKAQADMSVLLYDVNSPALKRIAVTGTNGKTSLVNIACDTFNALSQPSERTGTLGVSLKEFCGELNGNTTFPPAVYGRIAKLARQAGAKYLFSEISSHGVALGRVRGVNFDIAVFLNLSVEHLDYHKNMEAYYQAKKALFSQADRALINIDDKYGERLAGELQDEGRTVVTIGTQNNPDFLLTQLYSRLSESVFTLCHNGISAVYRVPLMGQHNAINAAMAIVLALMEGHLSSAVAGAIKTITQIPGRLERVNAGNKNVYIDYAHTPDALQTVIAAIKEASGNNLIVVFGCGGDRDRAKRPEMGAIAVRLADKVIFTNDNPRRERPAAILAEILSGVTNDNYLVIPDREQAISWALSMADENTDVLIAGKGHEQYQLIGDEKRFFSDKLSVLNILSKQ